MKIKMKNRHRRFLSFFVALCIMAGLVPLMSITASANPGGGGSGSVSDPFLINNLAELQEFRNRVNSGTTYLNQHIKLNTNITLPNIENNWTPIGTEERPFHGTFNGNGHTIKGLLINTSADNQGFFGFVGTNGTVENVGLLNAAITGSGNRYGGIVGSNYGTVQNSYFIGEVTGGNFRMGGIAGHNSGIVRNCYADVTIIGNQNSGGIVGLNIAVGRVTNCYVLGTVHAIGIADNSGMAGGIVGQNHSGSTISNSVALAAGVVSGAANSGRITGTNNDSTLTNNRARDDTMVLINSSFTKNPLSVGQNAVDGADITLGTTANSTVFNGWDTSIWHIPSEDLDLVNLPTLRVFERTITYDGNGNTDGVVPTGGTFQNSSTITALSAGTLEKEGYRFAGWNTEADGSGTAVSAGGSFVIQSDTTLYAQWRVVLPNNATIRGAPNSYDDVDVQARIVDLTERVYRIDISWGEMKFIFNTESATWNPDTREFDDVSAAGWSGMDGTNNQITVSNHSNADVRVSFAVTNNTLAPVIMEVLRSNDENGAAAVNMKLGKVPVSGGNAPNIEAYLRLSGEPSAIKIEELKNTDAWHKVGIITITIIPDGDVFTPLR